MKISIDPQVDALYLKFNDNKVVETIQLEINVDIDSNNKVVGLEVLHYSKLKQWANELLQENNLYLNEDSSVFFLHQGYNVAWFDIRDVEEEYTVCKTYTEEGSIQYDLVQNFIQNEVDFAFKTFEYINDSY
jgi:uncharacterized protein YuzE